MSLVFQNLCLVESEVVGTERRIGLGGLERDFAEVDNHAVLYVDIQLEVIETECHDLQDVVSRSGVRYAEVTVGAGGDKLGAVAQQDVGIDYRRPCYRIDQSALHSGGGETGQDAAEQHQQL